MTQNNMNASQSSLNTAIQRLSSGLRINSAKDDAAGQAIANRFTANIRGLTQAQRNANDGISIAQTTEGALTEVNNNLQRIRELSVQAATGTNSASDLDSIQAEIGQRLDEINRVSDQTSFNGVKVLSANAGKLTIQVGANDGETIDIDLKEITAKTLGLDGFNVNGTGTVQNRAANVNDLAGPNVTALTGANINKYDVTSKNTAATSADVLGKLSKGDTVAVAAGATYTYDAGGNFTYTKVDTGANISTSIKGSIGSTPVSATYKNNSQEVAIKIDSTGKITGSDGSALYYDTAGNLSATDNGGGWSQATVDNLTTFMGTAATAAGVSLSVNGTTYKSQAAGTANIAYETTASTSDVLTAMNGVAATISMKSGVLSTSLAVSTAGAITQGTDSMFVDAKGGLTTTEKTVQRFQFDQVSGKISAIAGGDTYKVTGGTSTAQGIDPNAATIGQQLFIGEDGSFTLDKTHAGKASVDPLAMIDAALSKVDSLRGSLGAVQNRFDSAIANLGTTITNLSSSRSRIQDADYAVEVSNMTRANILQQAGTSVLAQANQTTQGVLSLLR
jgi:flagellin